MDVELEPVAGDAAGDVKLADGVQVELVEKRVDVEAVVRGVAFEVVDIEQQAATGPCDELVQETRVAEVTGIVGQEVDDVLEQERELEAALDLTDPLHEKLEHLLRFRHREHRSQA